MIAKSFKDYAVYINACPKDFLRPSFLLEFIRISHTDMNYSTVEKNVYFTITCFVPVDERYQSHTEELINLQESVLQLFSQGYIPIKDRAIKVRSSVGGIDKDKAYIDLQLDYFDSRTDANEQTELPLMASVYTRMED